MAEGSKLVASNVVTSHLLPMGNRRMRKIPAVLVAGTLLSNCGGGGGSPQLPVPNAPKEPTTTASFSIKVPASVAGPNARRGKYIPANAGSVRVSVTSVNGAAPNPAIPDIIQAISPTATGCTMASGNLVCTVTAIVPVGQVALTVTIYQSGNGTGTPLATNVVNVTINASGTSVVAVTLGGVPSTIQLGGQLVVPADGAIHTLPLNVSVQDASGATIIAPGTYSVPITLAITGDPNGALTPATTQVTGPAASGPNIVAIAYNSAKPLTSATITASATGSTSATASVDPLVYSPTNLSSMVINGLAGSITVSEAEYGGVFAIAGAAPNTTTCVPTNCTPTTAGGQVTINVQPASVAGLVTMTVSDTNSVAASVPLGVAATTGMLSIPGAPSFFFDPLTAGYTSPIDPVVGGDGRIWVSERNGTNTYAGAMTLSTGVTANYPIGTTSTVITSVAAGPDGNVWYVDDMNLQVDIVAPNGAYSVNTTNGALSVPDVVAEGPDNQMWVFGTRFLPPANGVATIGTNGSSALLNLTGSNLGTVMTMQVGPDGNMWFVQRIPSAVGTITPGGFVTLYTSGLTGTPNPGLALGADGCMWFTESSPNVVGKIQPGTGAIHEFNTGYAAGMTSLGGVAEGADGDIWFSEQGANSVGRITTSGAISNYTPGGHSFQSLVLAPNGQLWFSDPTGANLGWLTY